jgi:asparagine synthase (glutamine-hydrolysing)
MCGIAGWLSRVGAPADQALIERMRDTLAHRGPDDAGAFVDGPIALGHRRLSVLDTSPGGHQPAFDPAKEIAVVYNGELYNYPALRRHLEERGIALRTRSDTETLPHLWRLYGPEMVARLRGMFAIALWDRRSRTLFLARDRFGQKPLYYAVLPDRVVFASELKALLEDPAVPRRVGLRALRDYFALGFVPDPRTIYEAVRKLPPAHTLTIRAAGGAAERPAAIPEPSRYWEFLFDPEEGLDARLWEERLAEKLDETVRAHMLSDVPLGAFLSGGVDSSTIVAFMTRASPRVKTFSIGFAEEEYSESHHARAVAERLGTDHTELVMRPDAVDLVTRLSHFYDEPFADSSAVPTYLVSKLAREHVTVSLSGDGGDELFAGYNRYITTLDEVGAERWVALRRLVFGPLEKIWPVTMRGAARIRRLAGSAGATYVARFLCPLGRELAARTLARELYAAGYDPIAPWQAIADAPGLPLAQRLQSVDIESYLPGDILVKVDRASMAVSLESRAPFLDHELAELAARIPSEMLIDGRGGKKLLKAVAKRFVPASAIDRPKMGFGVPVAEWLRGPLRPMVQELLLAPDSRTRALYRPRALERVVAQHASGRRNWQGAIWTMLMLELFWRRWAPAVGGWDD